MVIKAMKIPGTAVIQAYLALFILIIMQVVMIRPLEARSWLLMPNNGQMLVISPVYTR